jgi:NAD(P)-dependent dehydrogenase (short-subunit alcohol dehydrogenase family)
MSGRLEGRVAIVTGTSPNIGGSIAGGFAAEGARLVCVDLTKGFAQGCATRIEEAGGEAVAVVGDVTDPACADEAVERAEERWGRVDVLMNSAVYFNQRSLMTSDYEDYRRQLEVILGGAFLFTRAATRSMIRTGTAGSVINVLSTAAWQGQPGNIGYATGKSGLINFTRSIAMEMAEHGIRVNGLTPTATQPTDPEVIHRTAELTEALTEYPMDFMAQFPMRRLPTPEDYVPAAVFLACDDSLMITGTNITVDGGATAKYWPWRPNESQ